MRQMLSPGPASNLGRKPHHLINIASCTEADLRERALSAAFGGALQWRKFSIFIDPKQIVVLSPTTGCATGPFERFSALPPDVPLGPLTYTLAQHFLLLLYFLFIDCFIL